MRSALRVVIVAAMVAGVTVIGGPASAACHAFFVSASPNSAVEGSTVTITVGRDNNVSPSNVRVQTIAETATSGTDFTPLDTNVEFTNDTQRSFEVKILDDAAAEGAETFRVHLSNPGGCPVNTNYSVSADQRVTIRPSDQPDAPPDPTPEPAPDPTPEATGDASPTPTATATADASGSPLISGLVSPTSTATTEGGGTSALAILGALLGIAAVGGGVFFIMRRQSG